MTVVGYATPGKAKAYQLLEAFCGGAGGSVVAKVPDRLLPGAAAFYGVTPATAHLWYQARREGRDWYYIDNAYFDQCREKYFRVTRNALQRTGRELSDGKRLAELGVKFKPWREAGEHILVCPQSDEFMRLCAEYSGSWLEDTLRALRAATKREVRVRSWNRNKAQWYASFPEDLKGCHAVVVYSSASATTAMTRGVPAFVTARDCVAAACAHKDLATVDQAGPCEGLGAMAAAAADGQFTVAEMKSGLAWRVASA